MQWQDEKAKLMWNYNFQIYMLYQLQLGLYIYAVVTWTLSHLNKLYGTADYLVRFVSLELDQTQTGSTHPTPPHLKIILKANIFKEKLSTWIDINV